MAKIVNITVLSRVLKKSERARGIFHSAVHTLLHILEHMRLIDNKQLSQVTISLERGQIEVGDTFFEQLMGHSIAQYMMRKSADRKMVRDTMTKQVIQTEMKKYGPGGAPTSQQ